MRSALSSIKIMPALVLAAPCLTLLLSGCDESYPTELTYPLRNDPIVVKVPGTTPWEPTGPGQLDKSIASFESQYIVEPRNLDANVRGQLDTALRKIFGTPAEPKVNPDDDDAQKLRDELKLDDKTLKDGSTVYRRHCMHCHGVPGDGRGPTGPWVSPHPRDYRQGTFKFISTDTTVNGRKPRRQDLRRTLERGIEGTSMPSFSLLEDQQLEQLISYVMHLSLRGEVEMTTMRTILNKEALENDSVADNVQMLVGIFLKQWSDSNDKGLQPTPYPYQAGDGATASVDPPRLRSVYRPQGHGQLHRLPPGFRPAGAVPLRRLGHAGPSRQPDGRRLSRRPAADRPVLAHPHRHSRRRCPRPNSSRARTATSIHTGIW